MPAKLPRLKPQEAEKMLLKAGFEMIRAKAATGYTLKGTEERLSLFILERYYTQRRSNRSLKPSRLLKLLSESITLKL